MGLLRWLKNLWVWVSPTAGRFKVWEDAFKRLQQERTLHGYTEEYWRIWYDEVCPAYRALSEAILVQDPLTKKILEDIDKPMDQWRLF